MAKKLFFILIAFLVFSVLPVNSQVSISDDTWENRPHFKIITRTATYFYDKAGGGLSRVIDSDGIDWVNFNGDINATFPTGASGGYRGIPNMLYKFEDAGAGHPGFDKCVSEKAGDKEILTRSKSGKWQWRWIFFDDHARLTIEKTDTSRSYWFLYEGVVAGTFEPAKKYWGTDLGGPRYETPALNKDEIIGKWQWVYFGDTVTGRIFFVAQDQKDTLNDYFAYMGNTREGNSSPDGMIVFGFGRDKGPKVLETRTGISYTIGFLDRNILSQRDHKWAGKNIKSLMNR